VTTIGITPRIGLLVTCAPAFGDAIKGDAANNPNADILQFPIPFCKRLQK